jgi:hypothetical protein
MIWLKLITNPIAVAVLGLAVSFGAFQAGQWLGHRAGVAEQKAAQVAVDAEQSAAIRERVQDALREAGADATDDDVDRFLRGLAGQ